MTDYADDASILALRNYVHQFDSVLFQTAADALSEDIPWQACRSWRSTRQATECKQHALALNSVCQ
jgi:hypothetical protein